MTLITKTLPGSRVLIREFEEHYLGTHQITACIAETKYQLPIFLTQYTILTTTVEFYLATALGESETNWNIAVYQFRTSYTRILEGKRKREYIKNIKSCQ